MGQGLAGTRRSALIGGKEKGLLAEVEIRMNDL